MSDSSPDAAAAAESWSRYWASGSLHSCPNAFPGNYDDEIRDFWMTFFGSDCCRDFPRQPRLPNLQLRWKDREMLKQLKGIRKLLQRIYAYGGSRPHAGFLGGIAAQVAATLQQIQTIGAGATLQRPGVLQEEMNAHRERLRAIARAGKSREDMDGFCTQAAAAGFIVEMPQCPGRRWHGEVINEFSP